MAIEEKEDGSSWLGIHRDSRSGFVTFTPHLNKATYIAPRPYAISNTPLSDVNAIWPHARALILSKNGCRTQNMGTGSIICSIAEWQSDQWIRAAKENESDYTGKRETTDPLFKSKGRRQINTPTSRTSTYWPSILRRWRPPSPQGAWCLLCGLWSGWFYLPACLTCA